MHKIHKLVAPWDKLAITPSRSDNFLKSLVAQPSVIITSSATFSSILLINEVSVVIVISKPFKFEKRLQY